MPQLFIPITDNGGGVQGNFMHCFIHAFSGRDVQITRKRDSLITRGRNSLAADFLESDCEYLLFIDGDIIFQKQHIDWLMESDHDLICGIYPLKQQKISMCFQTLPGVDLINLQDRAMETLKPVEVRRSGTGFMRISRACLEKLKTHDPVSKVDRNQPIETVISQAIEAHRYVSEPFYNHARTEWRFFPEGVINGEYLSEDWYFCEKWRHMGERVYIDPRVQLQHEGSIIFPLMQPEDMGYVKA